MWGIKYYWKHLKIQNIFRFGYYILVWGKLSKLNEKEASSFGIGPKPTTYREKRMDLNLI